VSDNRPQVTVTTSASPQVAVTASGPASVLSTPTRPVFTTAIPGPPGPEGPQGPAGPQGPPGLAAGWYITPKDYGAIGDGVADDTVPLQNAFAAAAAQGRPCVITPGTYMGLNVTVPAGARIRGTRNGVLMRVSSAASSVLLNLTGSDIHLDDLVLDGNGSGLGAANSGVVQCGTVGLLGIWVRSCRIANTHNHALRMINTAGDVHVIGCNFVNIGVSGNGFGVAMNSQNAAAPVAINDVEVAGCTFHRNAANTAGYGIQLRGSDDGTTRILSYARVIGNHVDHSNGSGTGLGIEVWAKYTVIASNTVRGAGGGLGISFGVSDRGVIVGNTVYNKAVGIEAIAASGAQYVSCVGNLVETATTGIVSWSASGRGLLADNVIIDVSGTPMRIAGQWGIAVGNLITCPAATTGINTTQSALFTLICGNTIEIATTGGSNAIHINNNTAGVTQRFAVTGNIVVSAVNGVRVQGTGGATAIQSGTISGNDLSGATTPIFLDGTTTKGNVHRWANAGDVPTITGSRAGNAALASFLAAQSSRGLITDSTTA